MITNSALSVLRENINNIDKNIIKLLAQRKNLVLKIIQFKIENHQAIRDVEREKNILKKIMVLGKKNNLQSKYITQLFQLIIEESVSTQQDLLQQFCKKNKLTLANFAVLGPKGSFSYLAACEYAIHNFKKCITNECSTFEEVILSVENNESDYAVLPIENTCSGSIDEVFDLLKKTNLFIIGEINLCINHCLLAIKEIELNKIKTIYSHPQPFKQCSNFIKNFPEWRIEYTKSTTDAMKKIIKLNDSTHVALGSEIGSKIYNLKVLSTNITNKKKNITRFILLHKNPININKIKQTKTTLIFLAEPESKLINHILSTLQEKKILIRKLISQKTYKNSLEKMFYLDIQENLSSEFMQYILKKIKKITHFTKVLGCYPYEHTDPIIPQQK